MHVFKVMSTREHRSRGSDCHVLVSIVCKRKITYASDKTFNVDILTFTPINVDVENRKFE